MFLFIVNLFFLRREFSVLSSLDSQIFRSAFIRSPRLESTRLAQPRLTSIRFVPFDAVWWPYTRVLHINMYICFWKPNVILFWKLLHMWLNVLKFRFSKFIVYFVYFKRYTLRHFILPSIYMYVYTCFYIFPHTLAFIHTIHTYVRVLLFMCLCVWVVLRTFHICLPLL